MSSRDILALFPSRANFVLMKQRITSATTGLSLLKRKRDALEYHLRQILRDLNKYREQIEAVMQEASLSMAKAKFLATDFKPATVEQPGKADAYVEIKNNKIVGMLMPTLELFLGPSSSLPLTGLSGGGQQVQVVREKYQEALKILIALASLEYNAKVLQAAVNANNRRVNGLEYVVLPRYHNTLSYIRDELDEFEREDFYRLKRSQAKQQKKKTEFLQEIFRRSKERVELPQLHIDISDYDNKTMGAKQMGLKGDPTVPQTRKTIVNVKGNTVVLLPGDKMKPVQLKKRKKFRPLDDESKLKSTDVVTQSPRSSMSTVSSSTYR